MGINQTSHPSLEALTAFFRGEQGPVAMTEIERHLAECPKCCETLRHLPADDTFVRVLRTNQEVAAPEPVAVVQPAQFQWLQAMALGRENAPSGFAPTFSGPPEGFALSGDRGPTADPRVTETILATNVPTLPAAEPVDASTADFPPELLNHPRYHVVRRLGTGGMGAVYLAEHKLMHRHVAIKVMRAEFVRSPAAVERFRREVQAAARLTSPHIVAAYDAEDVSGLQLLVMEFVDGTDLAQVIARRGPLPIEEACHYARQTALGLAHAHQAGMVHRDIKPQNLMLADGPADDQGQRTTATVKILDFGLASFASGGVTDGGLTCSGAMMGTPDYIAPEQARDARSADIRADIFSLGCTLHFLLTGQTLHPEGTALSKVLARLEQDAPPLSKYRDDAPEGLQEVVSRLMARRPEDRYQTPAEAAAALAPYCGSFLSDAPQPPVPSRRGRLVPVVATALGAFLLATALGAVYYVTTDEGTFRVESLVDDVSLSIQQGGKELEVVDLKSGARVRQLPSGQYDIRVKEGVADVRIDPDGFMLRRGETAVVRVTRVPRRTPPVANGPADPEHDSPPAVSRDRQAVEWIARIGATSKVVADDVVRHVQRSSDIPAGDLRVTEACLWPVQFQPSARFDRLSGLSELTWLRLFNCQITDAGVKQIKDCPKLEFLDLAYNPLSDEGVAHVAQEFPHLKGLLLYNTRITDKSLSLVSSLKELDHLQVSDNSITNEGLAALGELPKLKSLAISGGTRITDAGLVHLARWPTLTFLALERSAVTDEGLKSLFELQNLETLFLSNTRVTDAGLEHLARLKSLKLVQLRDTRATESGIDMLRAALPELRIEHQPPAQQAASEEAAFNRRYGQAAWTPLPAHEATATGSARLKTLEDDSLLAEGELPLGSVYRIAGRPKQKRVTALRLDVLHHESLPSGGPGRAPNGTFVLSGVSILAHEAKSVERDEGMKELKLRLAMADYSQPSHIVGGFASGNGTWAIWREGEGMRDQSLVLEFAEPLDVGETTELIVELRQEHPIWLGTALGHFRLSTTDAPFAAPAIRASLKAIAPPAKTGD